LHLSAETVDLAHRFERLETKALLMSQNVKIFDLFETSYEGKQPVISPFLGNEFDDVGGYRV
jgi:hypothetical protein